MDEICSLGKRAKEASYLLAELSPQQKRQALLKIADKLEEGSASVLEANRQDLQAGEEKGMTASLLDRLRLTEARIGEIAQAVRAVADLPDPVGRVLGEITRPNGLRIVKKAVPMGVIGIIYEARPNVTVDAAVLCFKSSNACILRGGKEAIRSNLALTKLMREALSSVGLPADSVLLVEDTSRESSQKLMRLREYLDLLIPRGGEGLIRSVVETATVPVIQTGVGNCHIYVDRQADFKKAVEILVNAKTSRPSVCNAAETLLVHREVAASFLPLAGAALEEKGVELRGCPESLRYLGGKAIPAQESDYQEEFLDNILAVKIVGSLEEALEHIRRYGTKHSEAIVTEDQAAAQKFLAAVDAAAVYVNASTRFTDGGEFGLGAEIGISTQKLHARGPMGLEELTTYKYLISGNGQIR